MSISEKDFSSKASHLQPISWFALLLALTGGFQILRLMQNDPMVWLAVDYCWRMIILALLAFSPMRSAVFRSEPLRISHASLVTWLLGVGVATVILSQFSDLMWRLLPDLSLGQYPHTVGWVHRLDLIFGLALVAFHEELFFRRFARVVFQRLGDGFPMIVTTSLVFSLYHWWTGLPNILVTAAVGVLLMLLYRTAGALWPSIVVHYVWDLWAFA